MDIDQSHKSLTRIVNPSDRTDDPGSNPEPEIAVCSVGVGTDDGRDGLAIRPTLPSCSRPSILDSPPLDEPPIRVMALHALFYCERLFYLEEVEEIRVADHAVYAGRRLHDDVAGMDDETPEQRSVEVSSDDWGIFGKVDAVRRRDGAWVAYEHKRGRCRRGNKKEILPWPSDRIQAVAYAVLLEEGLGEPVPQARIRYHADNVTALVDIDDQARSELRDAIERARQLRRTTDRPPVTDNENLCPRCSLAPVCLPEEERLSRPASKTPEDVGDESDVTSGNDTGGNDPERPTPRLFPSNRQRQTLHITQPRARIGRSAETLVVTTDEGKETFPIHQIDSVLIHGYGQISTQAIQLCAYHGVAVQWLTVGGKFVAGTTASPGRVQQRLRQYEALADSARRFELARRLVHAKIETQLRYILRATRGLQERRHAVASEIERCREALRKLEQATRPETLLGLEGIAAKAYFASVPHLLSESVPAELRPSGRSKHPPRDCFNAALSFGYALIHSLVHRSITAVGLEPAFGFYHQPRTAAPPLVLDVMELFRTPLWDMPLIGSLNRSQWTVESDFEITKDHVWLSAEGRKKAIQLFEQRLQESYKHPHTGQSLEYARIVELEVRLLEKEWTGCPGLFAQLRMR
ncbi:MAG: type I-MYXAN CRISPR-associated endonuclease Cas1 [Planctomycetota bacterium]|nr:type I-MYXAN CRISPR-associated endonuclease Cas1 [Planctomycetota bacterium]